LKRLFIAVILICTICLSCKLGLQNDIKMQRHYLLDQYNPYSSPLNSTALFPGQEAKLFYTFEENISYRVVIYEYKTQIPFSVNITGHAGDTLWTINNICNPVNYDFIPNRTEELTISIKLDTVDKSLQKKKGYDIVVLIATK
jgi:hypothetical protein